MTSSKASVYTWSMENSKKVIFFDGYCGLCDRFISEIFLRDKNHQFFFAPLQGPTARQTLPEKPDVTTVIYFRDGQILKKSRAVLAVLQDLGGVYSLFAVFKIVPAFFLDFVYDFIAKRRYGWFGESQFCRLPGPNEKPYFLD